MIGCSGSHFHLPETVALWDRRAAGRGDEAPRTVVEILRRQAEAHPGKAACHYRDAQGRWAAVSWRRHWGDIVRAAGRLRAAGVGRGDRLAIMAPSCREWQVAEMAGLLLGAVIVGVDAHATPQQIGHVLLHSGASAVVCDGDDALGRIPAEALMTVGGYFDLRKLCAGRGIAEEGPDPSFLAAPDPDDPATIIYTSGTTGAPKGIGYSHRQLMAACDAIVEAYPGLGPTDSTVCWLPMSCLLQRMMNLVTMRLGAELYFAEDPREIVEVAREAQPTVLVGVPRFFERFEEGVRDRVAAGPGWMRRLFAAALAAGDERARRLRQGRPVGWRLAIRHALLDRLVLRGVRRALGGRIRFMISGSAPMPVWLLEFYAACGLPVLEAYGVSENTVPVAANRPGEPRFGSVGRPLSANRVRLSPEGEVLVQGPGLFRGYHGIPDGESAFTPDGFYRTGDMGRFDEDGFLHLTGRKADLIKTSTGRRISPARVEAVYRRSRWVDQVVVFGHGRERIAALVVPRFQAIEADAMFAGLSRCELAASPLLREAIRQDFQGLGAELPAHERIADFVLLDRPLSMEAGELTATLKVRRERIAENHAALIGTLCPSDPGPEARLAKTIAARLGVQIRRRST